MRPEASGPRLFFRICFAALAAAVLLIPFKGVEAVKFRTFFCIGFLRGH